ncbi:Dynein heavy chain, cytoplasmic [Gryllus bimaculatus]|nr:Dynein heavy chain, cytoplasmic [Gryllus bimaculatus]
MSPVGDDFRNCCRSYPSLLNNTTVDWIVTWPDRALTAVATFYLTEDAKIPALYQPNIVKHMVHVHSSVNKYTEEFFQVHHQKNYVTPKHFHDYIHTYLLLLEEKSASISEKCQLLATTIEQVAEAQTQMNDLQSKIITQKEAIEQKTKSCEKMLMKIKIATEKITKLNERAQRKNAEIEEKSRLINAEKEDVESILSEALPAFEFACLGIAELDRGDITEIRSLATPPEPLLIVCECVAILRGIKDVSWKAAKGMMADSNFLKSLQETNCELITMHQIRAVKAHMKKTQKLDQMKLISKAGFCMLKFIESVLAYCQVYREAKPKKDHVQSMEKERDRMETDLKELTQEIEMAKIELKKFANKYDGTVKDRKKLQQEMDLMLHCLSIAEKLVAGLETEKRMWSSDLQSLREKKKCLIGDCLLTAAFLSYVGPFTKEYRNRMLIEDWVHDLMQYSIPLTNPYSLEGLLLDNAQIVRWSSEGLPQDEISVQNGILTVYSRRFPLCLDPQEQAIYWIKRKEEENNLKILTFSDCDFLKKLELAVTIGSPVMFEDIEEYVDPLIYSLLERSTRVTNGQTVIKLGDKEVEYNSNFQLYLVTKLTNPNFEPAVYSKANIINFTITNLGLEEQLLTIVVQHEHPDVEIKRNALIKDINSNKSLLKYLKANLLDKVANAPSYILDNVDLLDTLEQTKLQVEDISDKILQANQAAKDIDCFRNDYLILAEHGSILFSVVSNMATVDTMYKYSLTSFKNLFHLSLQKAVQDNQIEVRLKNVINTLTKFVYDYVCIGVYQRHKILFSFQLTLTLEMNKKQVSKEQIKFFVWGNRSMAESIESPAEWITSQIWKDILFLTSCFPSFSNLSDDIRKNLLTWKKWFDHNTPESVQYPMNYRKKLTPFECLMLLRCFRYDRVYPALLIYISRVMGKHHSEIRSYASSRIPVLFILSPGSDPIDELMKQARLCGFGSRFRYLSLGCGQENHALFMIKIAMQRGQWLLLQNCHLLINFVRDLIKEIEKIGTPHSDFRLWMTTKSKSNFPTSLLQSSFKVVFESPNSVKKNIQKTFVNLPADALDSCEHPAFKRLFYGISFFHAVLQERSKYGKFGWNLCYDFNEYDFGVCTQLLIKYLKSSLEENNAKIMWEGLKYLIGKVIYGGKVNDIYDQSIIQMYLDQYIGDFLFESADTFYFYKDQNVEFDLPSVNSYEDYIASIDKLPFTTNPKILGLNSNSEIIYNKKLLKEFEHHLQKLQPQEHADGCIEILDEKLTADIITNIMEKIPEIYDIKKIKESQASGSEQTAMFVVLLQELERFNALITCMHKTLQALQQALVGELRMDEVLEEMSWSMVQGHLPTAWQKLTPPTCKLLGSWLEHFEKRVTQYTNWVDSGEPYVMWISGLHVPKSYLAAVMQIACHKNRWPLDDTTLLISCTSWKKREEIIPDDDSSTRHLQGLYLNGARWSTSKNCLIESKTRILIEELPFLKVKAIKHQSLKLVNTIRIPVYATSRRRINHIDESSEFEVVLGIEEHKSHWILQNVCILLNED